MTLKTFGLLAECPVVVSRWPTVTDLDFRRAFASLRFIFTLIWHRFLLPLALGKCFCFIFVFMRCNLFHHILCRQWNVVEIMWLTQCGPGRRSLSGWRDLWSPTGGRWCPWMRWPPDAGWDEYSSGSALDRDLQTRVKQSYVTLEPSKATKAVRKSGGLFTCEGVHQLRGFYIIEVGGSIPGCSDHLLSSHQPISCYHHPLVALQGRGGHTDSGAFVGPICLAVRLVFIREVHVIVQRGLNHKGNKSHEC